LRFGENEIFGAKIQTSYFPKLINKTVGVQSTVCGMFQGRVSWGRVGVVGWNAGVVGTVE
jgi:hypothetical protein